VLKKYRMAVQQVSAEQAQLQEAQVQIAALEAEKTSLKDQLSELSQRLESVEQLGDPTANSLATRRLEFRTKELESKLELEQTTRARLEVRRSDHTHYTYALGLANWPVFSFPSNLYA
jgi:myosin-18